MQIHLTRNILLFANFILKQKILKQITLHVLALLEYGCVWNPKLYILFLWNICLNIFLGGKGLNSITCGNSAVKRALFDYRLIGATFIGNFIEDPFLN